MYLFGSMQTRLALVLEWVILARAPLDGLRQGAIIISNVQFPQCPLFTTSSTGRSQETQSPAALKWTARRW